MRIIKIKNLQATDVVYASQNISAGEYYEIQNERERIRFEEDSNIYDDIFSDPAKVLINNGIVDLNPQLSWRYLTHGSHRDEFDNTSNGFQANNVQDAIEEAADAPQPDIQEDDNTIVPGANTINFEGNVNVTDEGNDKATVTIEDPSFGVFDYDYAESENQSSTTNTSYQRKLRLITSSLPAGNYKIEWYYEWKFSNGNFEFKHRVQIDDTTTLKETETTPRSVGDWQGCSGFKSEVMLDSGVHNIDMDYCTSKSNKTAYIRRARIEIWRVS